MYAYIETLYRNFIDQESPEVRSGHAAVAWHHVLYVWGGYCSVTADAGEDVGEQRHNPRTIWKYHLRNHSWTKVMVRGYVPPSLLGSCYISVNGELIVFGGHGLLGDDNHLYALSLDALSWRLIHPKGKPPSPRNKLACCAYRGRIIYFGGYGPEPEHHHINNGQFDLDHVSMYEKRGWNNHLFAYDMKENSWIALPIVGHTPSTRAAHSCASLDNKAFIFGGRHLERRLDDMHSLCLETYCWTTLKMESGPVGRSWHSLTPVGDDTLFLFGGLDTSQNVLADGWVYDVKNNTWIEVRDGQHHRLWHSACIGSYFGQVVIYGGCESNVYLANPKHSSKITVFEVNPKTLVQSCLEVLAANHDKWITKKDILPNVLYRKLAILAGNGG